MAHSYPLHVDLVAPCECCGATQPFRFSSASDHVICAFCTKHLGTDKAMRRDADHVRMWVEIYTDETDAHAADIERADDAARATASEIAALQQQVSELTGAIAGEFTATPVGAVRTLLETDLVKRAERNAQLAARRTDRVMVALWRLAQLHHDNAARPQQCSCGKSIVACAEYAAVEPERRTLTEWEDRNLALLRAGSRHALPAEHPAL